MADVTETTDADASVEMRPCAYCGALIHPASHRCTHCGGHVGLAWGTVHEAVFLFLVLSTAPVGGCLAPGAGPSLVRVGFALYGLPPAPALHGHGGVELRPVMSLRARVTMVKELPAGARLSYGLRYELDHPSRIATVPAGYADGVPRNLGLQGGEVLIGGRRLPIAGVVTMDQLLVDVGDAPVEAGDEVVLIGRQGNEEITATEWAQHLGTINYEIVTGIGARVPRTSRGERAD